MSKSKNFPWLHGVVLGNVFFLAAEPFAECCFEDRLTIETIFLVMPFVLKLMCFSNMFKILFNSYNLTFCFLAIVDHHLSAFQSICRCLLMDFETHAISLLLQLQHLYCYSRKSFAYR